MILSAMFTHIVVPPNWPHPGCGWPDLADLVAARNVHPVCVPTQLTPASLQLTTNCRFGSG